MDSPEVPLCAVTGGMMLGGSSTFLVNLTHGFQARGLQLPIVILSGSNEHAEDFAALNAPITLISQQKNIYEDRLALAYETMARWRPRAVLACLGGSSFEVLRLLPPGVSRLAVIQSHDSGPYLSARQFSPWIDALVGVSRTIRDYAAALPELAGARVTDIPYGIAFGAPVPRASTRADEPLRLVYVGRMVQEQKQVGRLGELIRLLAGRGVPFQFTFVGSGSHEVVLKKTLSSFKAVHFRGEVPNHLIPGVLAEQDVLVLLSDYEGLPLSLLEAMGSGVVPVVSDLESGIRDVVNSQTGVRVPIGDVTAAAEAITRLGQDREQLATMAAAAARLVREDYSAARMAERYLNLVEQFPPSPVNWPERATVPVPMGVTPWLYRGGPRVARRWIKRFLAGVRP